MTMPFFVIKKSFPKILFVASEAAPFVKAGGLGEVMFSLPRALKELGYDARVMIPCYAGVDREKYKLKMEAEGLRVPTGAEEENQLKELICNVKKFESKNGGHQSPVTTYFLENEEYYEKRANIYGYGDDAVRWALLSRGVLEFLRISKDWRPDVIVASDWQAGFLISYLHQNYKDDPKLNSIATVFSIHNLYYQGMFDHRFVTEMDFDDGHSLMPSFFSPRLLKINAMRRGIKYADIINTVSSNYAKEIMTPAYGELLDDLLRERRSRVYGVLNGLDYETINPGTDPHLAENYIAKSLGKRISNKAELQTKFNLPAKKDVFVLGIISRLDEQKGFDLLFSIAEPLLKQLKLQLIILGSGDSRFMSFFQNLGNSFPEQVSCHLGFDEVLPHLIRAGADAVLIPSRFEPAGLVQMEAMCYGAVPIVRKTGGLADTVEDYNPRNNSGTGFVFKEFDSLALTIAITRAFENYQHRQIWQELQKRGMEKDFSWKKSAQKYLDLFFKAIDLKKKNALG
jgi:starch synthase